jgi:hypothetical protein
MRVTKQFEIDHREAVEERDAYRAKRKKNAARVDMINSQQANNLSRSEALAALQKQREAKAPRAR